MDLPSAEQLLANAIQYLIQGDNRDAALLLLQCEAAYGIVNTDGSFTVTLLGPRAVYEALKLVETVVWGDFYDPHVADHELEQLNAARNNVSAAFTAVAPPGFDCTGFGVRVSYAEIEPGWREKLLDMAEGREVNNQGVEIPGREVHLWKFLRFRSKTETLVAEHLDTTGVLFLPNCLARLNHGEGRATREADFLVCHKGKWGILEVDGPHHQRAATDHNRDRLFQEHGIRVTQRFTAEECYEDAGGVVRRFLLLLEKNG